MAAKEKKRQAPIYQVFAGPAELANAAAAQARSVIAPEPGAGYAMR
jgi:hypothetical protein